jgi:hypothetical protein
MRAEQSESAKSHPPDNHHTRRPFLDSLRLRADSRRSPLLMVVRDEGRWLSNKRDGRIIDGDVDTGPHLLSVASLGHPSTAREAGLRSEPRSDSPLDNSPRYEHITATEAAKTTDIQAKTRSTENE